MPRSEKRRGALTQAPSERVNIKADGGKVYTGGTPAFDESKGRYVAPPSGSVRLSPGVYKAPNGQLMTGQGRVLPSQSQGQRLAESMVPPQRVTLFPSGSVAPSNRGPLLTQQPMRRPLAPNEPMPMTPPPVDMQKPWMNYQPPQMPQLPQRPQLSQVANMSGEEIQALIAQNQLLQQAQQGADQGENPNSGPGSFPMQQRERELGYAENRFDAARNNNLFRGNPIRRFKF